MKFQLRQAVAAYLGLSALMGVTALEAGTHVASQPPMKAVYYRPARNWEDEALPIGNGYMGAMIFGGVARDIIQTNEKTLWSGGPGEDSLYNGGHLRTAAENHVALQEFRVELQKRMNKFDNSAYNASGNWREASSYDGTDLYDDRFEKPFFLNRLLGNKEHFGSFQTLSDIYIDDITHDIDKSMTDYKSYRRELDLDRGLQAVSYTCGGVNYHREYFMSYPDNVMVVRLTADKPFSRSIELRTKHSDYNLAARDNEILLTGWPTPTGSVKKRENDDWRDCLRFAQKIKVHSTDGAVGADGKSIRITNAREIVLVMSAATNYQLAMDDRFDFFAKEDPKDKVSDRIAKACLKSYTELLDTHLSDYKRLYDRNKILLGKVSKRPEPATDSLLRKLAAGKTDAAESRYLEMLYYQYGRYLLIASSRPGSLPANLQGVWGDRLANAWNADYHTNINVEMNYWPAEPCNLSECHIPMLEFVKSLEPRGTLTARHYHCRQDGGEVRGWTAYHEINAWANTAPARKGTHSMFPEGAAWLCCDIWEHYLFTQNRDFLAEYFDTMKNAALFWVDNLWTDERDGTLVANPSLSPEHGSFSLGCTASQGVIYELFDAVEKAASVLGRDSEPEIAEISTARSRLSMPKIGQGGQFMEWKDEVLGDLTGEGRWDDKLGRFVDTHRHTNHLFWLHPGTQIVAGRSKEENMYADAMKVTLNTRGDAGTGWSRAWKLNFWARLRDGDRAHKLLKSCMNLTYPGAKAGGVYSNLFDAHPPFQIDGNFGFTSGISEMLLQSQGGMIEILPALPTEWTEGSFRGMCARGGFVVDADWSEGKVDKAVVVAKIDNNCKVRIPLIKNAEIHGCEYKILDDNTIEAIMKGGNSMTIEFPRR